MPVMSEKIRLAVPVLLVFLLAEASTFALNSSPVYIQNEGRIGNPLVPGLPSADVYVVANSYANNYVILNGSNPYQVLETDSDAVVAVTHALSNWVPTNGKLVTKGTFDWDATFYVPKNNFTWEGWGTVLNVTSGGDRDMAIYTGAHSYINFNNLTVCGNNLALYGVGNYGNGGTYVSFTHCTIYFFTYGVMASSCDHWNFQYNNISFNHAPDGTIGQAFYITGTYDNISNNYIDCGGYTSAGGIVDGAPGNHNVINNNTILSWNNGGDAPNVHGIYTRASYDEIAFNNLTNTLTLDTIAGSCALHLKADHIYCHDNIVSLAGDEYGISSYNESDLDPHGLIVINNTFQALSDSKSIGWSTVAISIGGDGTSGANCCNMTFINNTFTGPWDASVHIENSGSPSYPIYNLTFSQNRFLNGHSIFQVGDFIYANEYIRDVYIFNNTFSNFDGKTNGWYGVPIEVHSGLSNIAVYNNAFSNCTTPLGTSIIECVDGNSALVASSLIYNNTGLQTGSHPFYMLNVSSAGSGTTSPYGLGWQYVSGTSISTSYIPNSTFLYWIITTPNLGTKYSNPISIAMNQSYALTGYGS